MSERITMAFQSPGTPAPVPSPQSRRVVAGTFTDYTYSPYQRKYKVYVPSQYVPGIAVPLLVMLHGCTQNPDDLAAGTQMNWYAEQYTFIVVYPEQPRRDNLRKCWNWFQPQHQVRGRGEPGMIMAIVDKVMQTHTIDRDHVYAAGMSAGGSMAIILGATYPDVFAAIGTCAAVAYAGATSVIKAFQAMHKGVDNPLVCGIAAHQAMGSYQRVVPIIVFHGSQDGSVAPINATQIMTQWAETNRLSAHLADGSAADFTLTRVTTHPTRGHRTYTEYHYADHYGRVKMKKYLVEGMGHAWPGGSTAGTFTDPYGPDASQLMTDFFFDHPLHPPELRLEPIAVKAQPVPATIATAPVPAGAQAAAEAAPPAPPEPPAGWWQRVRQSGGRLARRVTGVIRRIFANEQQ